MTLEIIGWVADAMFLIAYFLVSMGKLRGDGIQFNLLNFVGAVLYGFYAVEKAIYPVLVLEFFWGSVALVAIWRAYGSLSK